MALQRKTQIAELRLCRLIVHVLLDVPRLHQDIPIISGDDIALFDDRIPVYLEVRTGITVADLTFPVHREECRTHPRLLFLIHPIRNQTERFDKMRVICVQLLCEVALDGRRLPEVPGGRRLNSRRNIGSLHDLFLLYQIIR